MKTYLPTSTNQMRREEGAVLIVALVLLLVLTMLGISAIESTKLETKMAANTTNYSRAFQTAEAGLAQALQIYLTDTNAFDGISETEVCDTDKTDDLLEPLSLKDEHGKITGVAKQCVIKSGTELTNSSSETQLFYVVRSTGASQAHEIEDEDGNPEVVASENSLSASVLAGMSIGGPSGTTLYTQ